MELQYITHQNKRYNTIEGAKLALEGGCKWIQLRMKDASQKDRKETALILQKLCKEYQATFILDDEVLLAKEIKADGVHLGLNDMPIHQAREILGKDAIIGGTANTLEQAIQQIKEGANYLGIGPFRFTETKKRLSPVLGLEGYKKIVDELVKEDLKIPIVGIGGVLYEDIPSLLKTGIDGIALSGAILNANHPKEETKKILSQISLTKENTL